mgnify:CR=1 FL=1
MKIKAMSFEYEGRIALYLVPETDVERTLLQSLWKHGVMAMTNGVADGTGQGYSIMARQAKEPTDAQQA